ncbi:unnamed protein product [Rangifer tarandus platyrhynchus]|uniref:Uncharacterized protein n=2 Tax=Rangifer tarandus platyrhynchus TaxID=3082113 RepID=A0ABN8ZL92_RANTA|nr:unnamed protein product [Rangifer tarandus platyrhynchus]
MWAPFHPAERRPMAVGTCPPGTLAPCSEPPGQLPVSSARKLGLGECPEPPCAELRPGYHGSERQQPQRPCCWVEHPGQGSRLLSQPASLCDGESAEHFNSSPK